MEKQIPIYVLICTIDNGINNVGQVFLPQEENVTYVVAWQQTHPCTTPDFERSDVALVMMQGRGLSRNRNLAIQTAIHLMPDPTAEAIFVIADDDERFDASAFSRLRAIYGQYPKLDIALLRVRSDKDNRYFKQYPKEITNFKMRPRSYYPCSWEMTFRSRVWYAGIKFDERFGLGAPLLCSGEEDIFLTDAMRKGLMALIVPQDLGSTDPVTTGDFVMNPQVLLSKGAVYGYQLSLPRSFFRAVREALSLSVKNQVSPFPLFHHIWRGVKYIRS